MCNIVGGCSVGISIEGVILCEVVVLVSAECVILWEVVVLVSLLKV